MRSNASNALVRALDAVRNVVRDAAVSTVAAERAANSTLDATIRAEGGVESVRQEMSEIRRELREQRELLDRVLQRIERTDHALGQKEE